MKSKGLCAVCGEPGKPIELMFEKGDTSFAVAFYDSCGSAWCLTKLCEWELAERGKGWALVKSLKQYAKRITRSC